MLEFFKERNAAWEAICVIMTDKDLTERDVLARSFPQAQLLICLFHTFRSFRREISVEKIGITSGQRSISLELLQLMAYSPTEDKYLAVVRSCWLMKVLAQHIVVYMV